MCGREGREGVGKKQGGRGVSGLGVCVCVVEWVGGGGGMERAKALRRLT